MVSEETTAGESDLIGNRDPLAQVHSEAPAKTSYAKEGTVNNDNSKISFPGAVDVINADPKQDNAQPSTQTVAIDLVQIRSDSLSMEMSPTKVTPARPLPAPAVLSSCRKKRGRPRKNPLPDVTDATLGNSSPLDTSTPPRKRGRPPKVKKDDKTPHKNAPSSSDKRLMAAVRRNSKLRERNEMHHKPFPPMQPTFSRSQSPAPPVQYPNNGSASGTQMLTTAFTPVNQMRANHGKNHGFGPLGLSTATPYKAFTGYGTAGHMTSQGSPSQAASSTTSCDCNSVKVMMRDVFFGSAIKDQDVWVVPNVTALELHHYFGGGIPAPRGDLVLTSDKVEMIRNLLF
ncbi:hypothetical protein BKA67DRAFT_542147 [Truncatella angustata]|uniref:Uncharacterized protein n=1 Tax=Truncatella angustata TaxID=152316 RepID=A0A9P8RFP8_9PEZI|nr:uncharacterized protein BKA67DRAFT_542147 [Truncatella angustata]KAH6645168.1 hypothetical protein BKA67DRAFT_542147 [Truncatella angustata]